MKPLFRKRILIDDLKRHNNWLHFEWFVLNLILPSHYCILEWLGAIIPANLSKIKFRTILTLGLREVNELTLLSRTVVIENDTSVYGIGGSHYSGENWKLKNRNKN